MGKKYDRRMENGNLDYSVYPLKEKKDIDKLKQFFMGEKTKRNYALFVVGINVGLRCSDLVKLKVKDVYDPDYREFNDEIRIVEKKTGKVNKFVLNRSARTALVEYFKERPNMDPEEPLFLSRKHGPLNVKSVNRIIRDTCKELGIKGRYGSHTLRKTFGYWAFKKNAAEDPSFLYTLQDLFNHSSSRVTLRYIGIDEETKADVFKNLNL